MKLIGIAGAARAGKDTLARTVEYVLPGTIQMAFAHAVKLEADPICKERFGISAFTTDPEDKKIVRPVLIEVGHGRRQEDPEIWIKKLATQIDAHLPTRNIVVTDVRYANEAEMIHSKGGTIVFIQRNAQADIPTERESLPGIKWDIKIDCGDYNVLDLLRTFFPGIVLV
ncbi:MAG: hypothetical protein ACOYB3_00395 [Azonexus sp.]